MLDALSITEVEGQRIEALPARTVMSAFGGAGGTGGNGGAGGYAYANVSDNYNYGHDQSNVAAASANGGAGGSANGGNAAEAGRDINF